MKRSRPVIWISLEYWIPFRSNMIKSPTFMQNSRMLTKNENIRIWEQKRCGHKKSRTEKLKTFGPSKRGKHKFKTKNPKNQKKCWERLGGETKKSKKKETKKNTGPVFSIFLSKLYLCNAIVAENFS